jgi:hypothetical protein
LQAERLLGFAQQRISAEKLAENAGRNSRLERGERVARAELSFVRRETAHLPREFYDAGTLCEQLPARFEECWH